MLLSAPFLAAACLGRRSVWIIRETGDRWILRLTWNFCDCSMVLGFVFLTQQQRLNCVDVFISTRTASAAARTPVDCSVLRQQPVDAVLRPTLLRNFVINCWAFQPLHSYRFFYQNFVFFIEQRQSCRVCLIQHQNSRYFRCLVWKTKS